MKYIRTKDGQILDVSFMEQFMTEVFEGYKDKDGKYYPVEDIVKQDYTLKILCDEFVVAYEDGSKMVYNDLEWAKYQANRCLTIGNIKSIIYGSIWVDNNLIKVAKMNEQGELELL